MKFDRGHQDVLLDLLRWRRDVRHFAPTPVSAADVDVLKRAMMLAPSVGNSRPWRVVSVETAALREQLIANHTRANAVAAERYEGAQRAAYCALKLAALEEAPVQLAVFTETAPEAGHGLGRQSMPETLSYSTVLAIHGLWLAGRALNLGVGWVSILDADDVARTLDVEAHWRLTAYLCIGHPTFDDDTPELERAGWQERADVPWLVK